MSYSSFKVAIALGATLFSSCATLGGTARLALSDSERDDLVARYVGKDLVLASSMFVGDFYGDTQRLLADPRPADIIELYERNGDRLASPTFSDHVIFAGTPVRVTRIVFPQTLTGSIFRGYDEPQPTAHTWIELQQIGGTGNRPLVIVLPREIQDAREFRAIVAERIASKQRVTHWLDQRNFDIMRNIRHKRLAKGMSFAEMVAALGRPRDSRHISRDGRFALIADYGNIQAVLGGDVIEEVVDLQAEEMKRAKNERTLAAAAAERQAEEDARKRRIEEEREAKRRWLQGEMDREQRLAEERRAILVAKTERRERATAARAERRRLALERREAVQRAAREKNETVAARKAERKALVRAERMRKTKRDLDIELAEIESTEIWVRDELGPLAETAAVDLDEEREALAEAVGVAQRSLDRAKGELADAEEEGEDLRAAERDVRRALDHKQAVRAEHQARVDVAATRLTEAESLLSEQLAILEDRRARAENSMTLSDAELFGMRIAPVTDQRVRDQLESGGALIVEVDKASTASKAGFKAKDVIVELNGKNISGPAQLEELAQMAPEQQELRMVVWRRGSRARLVLPAFAEGSSRGRSAIERTTGTSGPVDLDQQTATVKSW